jgi:PAS domain-containing protein
MDRTEDAGKTKAQLIKELQTLRRQLAELQGREEKGREQAQESPFRERDMLHVLMDNVPDWIFFKDAESRIVRSNRAHAQLLGFDDPQEVVGKSDFDFFPSAGGAAKGSAHHRYWHLGYCGRDDRGPGH